jgi:hypothetical protein
MPRVHRKSVPVVAASPAMVAAMLNIRPDDLADAIAKKQIIVRQRGVRRRILIEDAIMWFRMWQEARPYKARKPKDEVSHADT